MHKLTITKEANSYIRKVANGEFDDSLATYDDKTVTFPIDDEVFNRLCSIQLPSETISDTIIRMVSIWAGQVS